MKGIVERPVEIGAGKLVLEGDLDLPAGALGVVLFAHGSGSSRFSPRNRSVARSLREEGIGTLLFDLLTPDEDQFYRTRFDIDLLTGRLIQAASWVQGDPETRHLPLGFFGASTGAAAALKAAAEMGTGVRAVVSRGGRPDLAGESLRQVLSPTLLIVGGEDHGVIELNRDAYSEIPAVKELVLIPGATHLFEEPGALEEVARRAGRWFREHLPERAGEGGR